MYGLDYLVSEASTRLAALASEVVSHLRAAPDALLVVEEYDKLDCAARGLWRQLLAHPERANLTSISRRAIILLESNLGMAELEEMLTELGDRGKVCVCGGGGGLIGCWEGAACVGRGTTAHQHHQYHHHHHHCTLNTNAPQTQPGHARGGRGAAA